jgi:hypothetical protein
LGELLLTVSARFSGCLTARALIFPTSRDISNDFADSFTDRFGLAAVQILFPTLFYKTATKGDPAVSITGERRPLIVTMCNVASARYSTAPPVPV